ncbi:hypothetical protein [Nostoc sp. DedSLP03]|uniref:hypothetical protein n=2 Tax=Nostoc TaxID=1177 RepID=UPI002AD4BBE7|nr:hypothetical protein [Nostoc sp. DedSLP03]
MKIDIATLISTDRKIYTNDKRFKVGTTNSNARKKQMNLPATVSTKLQKSAAFILLSLALVGLEIPSSSGQSLPNSSTKSAPFVDGTYLYGETPKPNQIGKAYLLLQRQQGNIVGALYYPNSEFSCFTGKQNNNTVSAKSLSSNKAKTENMKINLSNFHQIKLISANDQRILTVCKQTTVASKQLTNEITNHIGFIE